MPCSRSVTPLAINAQHDLVSVKGLPVAVSFSDLQIRAMTFDTAGGNISIEGYLFGTVTGAVAPGIQRRVIRNRQLKNGVALPVQISLPLSTGPDGDIEWFFLHLYTIDECLLEQSSGSLLHHYMQPVIQDQHILGRIETSFNSLQ